MFYAFLKSVLTTAFPLPRFAIKLRAECTTAVAHGALLNHAQLQTRTVTEQAS
jgi:hypothetical protein